MEFGQYISIANALMFAKFVVVETNINLLMLKKNIREK